VAGWDTATELLAISRTILPEDLAQRDHRMPSNS